MIIADPQAVLVDLAERQGTSLAALSAMLGRNHAYLHQYVTRGSPRTLAERDRRLLADYFGVSETALGGPAPARDPTIRLPRLDIAASAGAGAFVDGEVMIGADTIDAGLARKLGLRDGAAAIIRVRGDSMEPGLVDGDHIVVDTRDRSPTASGGIYVIRVDGMTMVKRVVRRSGALAASSDNPATAALPDAPIDIVGRVVWQMRAPR